MSLSAVVGNDSFFYRISQPSSKRYQTAYVKFSKPALPFYNPLDFLPDIFENNPLFYSEFTRVAIAFAGLPFIIGKFANQPLVEIKKMGQKLWFAGVNDRLFNQPIMGTGLHIAYSVPGKLVDELQNFFGRFHCTHIAGCLVQQFQKTGIENNHRIELNIQSRQCLITIWNGSHPVHARNVPYQTKEDILYFLHSAAGLCGCLPVRTTIQVSGPSANDNILEFLKSYYPDISYISGPDGHGELLAYQLIDITSLEACVL